MLWVFGGADRIYCMQIIYCRFDSCEYRIYYSRTHYQFCVMRETCGRFPFHRTLYSFLSNSSEGDKLYIISRLLIEIKDMMFYTGLKNDVDSRLLLKIVRDLQRPQCRESQYSSLDQLRVLSGCKRLDFGRSF